MAESTYSESMCFGCDARCCHDGVYLKDGEEERLMAYVNKHSEDFADLLNMDKPIIVDGDWPGQEDERKTNTLPRDDYDDDYPAHFTKTKCIFLDNEKRCRLEYVSEMHNEDPNDVKPLSCRMFPMRLENGKYVVPSGKREDDPDNIGDEYPGFISFMPCINKAEGMVKN